ncbi:hypothetical protein CIB48_g9287 [Xylaria polymorpha]|nr:hypothetical protein CIB48_g9287 [Xylaria polymorpha]
MGSDSTDEADESGDSNGDMNVCSRERQDGRSGLLTDSLYDGPLNHIIRNHPKLFVRPKYWTKRHCWFLHVVCKDERPQAIEQQDHEGSTQHVDKENSHASDEISQHASFTTNTDTDRLRVPSFQFPSLPHPHLNSHISVLRTERANAYSFSRMAAMQGLLVWRPPEPSNVWKTLLNPDYIYPQATKTLSYGDDADADDIHHRLTAETTSLFIRYGGRRISMTLSCPTYTFAGNTSYAQRNAWRLIYIDCAQLRTDRGLSKRQKRHQMMIARLGLDMHMSPDVDGNEGERDSWPLSQGYMTSIFIAMAQQREDEQQHQTQEHKANGRAPSQVPSHSIPQLQPRYQILLTDNDEDCSCIQLYTAHVSDFLLEHFRTPSRLPRVALSGHKPPLLQIHRTTIPFSPYISFRCRLRKTIMEYANGTAGGFFSDPNLAHDGE